MSAPLSVAFDGTGSSDPDTDALTYEWDLDGDGQLDDSTAAKPSFTYTAPGNYTVTLRVERRPGRLSTPPRSRSPSGSSVTTLQFTPDADARVEQAKSGTNYGSSSSLLVARGGTSLVDRELRCASRCPAITGPVQSAKLRRAGDRATARSTGPAVFTASSDVVAVDDQVDEPAGARDDRDRRRGRDRRQRDGRVRREAGRER